MGVLHLEAKLLRFGLPQPRQLNWTLLPFLISSSTFFLERFLLLLIVYLSIDPLIWTTSANIDACERPIIAPPGPFITVISAVTLKLGYTSLSICCQPAMVACFCDWGRIGWPLDSLANLSAGSSWVLFQVSLLVFALDPSLVWVLRRFSCRFFRNIALTFSLLFLHNFQSIRILAERTAFDRGLMVRHGCDGWARKTFWRPLIVDIGAHEVRAVEVHV